ncbi:phosphoribosylanthranilate isomerase [Lottiidibacillus patelloidae]|uniref:N-(5'-phosphoribosyl)anthranilate isomerase n=1 Tax=Lottiidibacillus patelloidae TaxID=2670334 RepID=A0A263BX14_9BACI|nr:phosphoribosylanthranilate isomerase [Lottiidibacillus patelloidae]OZM58102.1 phosphoribosylanthranilate isomerase [Lottiidibacillus patelloidae]
MKVKICGIKDLKTALVACQLGADAIGFVFASSKRQITVQQAKEVSEFIPNNVKKVGVFVNETIDRIQEIASITKLDMIQLHGQETEQFCEAIHLPVIKAFSVTSIENMQRINKFKVPLYLLDSAQAGSGQTFDWQLLKDKDVQKSKLMLAGGLTPENVNQAIKLVKPAWVDVSSGVETNGYKDLKKIRDFIYNAKR